MKGDISVEASDLDPKMTTLVRIIQIFEKSGIEFIRADGSSKGEGVRLARDDLQLTRC